MHQMAPVTLTEPGFVGQSLRNVTVPEGRDVVLSCTVKHLDGHKVRIQLLFCGLFKDSKAV